MLATNTSSLSVTEMAAELAHPERVVGLHFFNPVAVMPLLEIVRAEQTDDATLATAFAVGKELKKSCVLVKDAPAFVVNRLLTRFLGEVIAAVDAGTPIEVADAALDPLGLPMRPLALLSMVGPAVALHVAETLHEAFPDRFAGQRQPGAASSAPASRLRRPRRRRSTPRWSRCSRSATRRLTGRAGARARRWTRWPQEIRLMLDEGVVAEATGHRPVHDPRRGLAVPPGRHHAVPGPVAASPSGSPGSGSCPPGVASLPS